MVHSEAREGDGDLNILHRYTLAERSAAILGLILLLTTKQGHFCVGGPSQCLSPNPPPEYFVYPHECFGWTKHDFMCSSCRTALLYLFINCILFNMLAENLNP